jgi:hypothetical protein
VEGTYDSKEARRKVLDVSRGGTTAQSSTDGDYRRYAKRDNAGVRVTAAVPCVTPRNTADFERSKRMRFIYAGMDRPAIAPTASFTTFVTCENNFALSQLPTWLPSHHHQHWDKSCEVAKEGAYIITVGFEIIN